MSYWENRIRIIDQMAQQKAIDTDKELATAYNSSLQLIKNDIEQLYIKLLEEAKDQQIKPNDLYRYNRYFELTNSINREMVKLGQQEQRITKQCLIDMYNLVQDYLNKETGVIAKSFTPLGDAEKAIDIVWCQDGVAWSERIWANKQLLQKKIERGLIDSLVRGLKKDDIVKELMDTFNTGFNNADRIVRTELNFVQNQACLDRFRNIASKYEIFAAIDSRTSQICRDMDGKVFNFTDAQVGITMPPFHAYCRTTILPKED